jgi:phosphorylcholine metabolism protein LicD
VNVFIKYLYAIYIGFKEANLSALKKDVLLIKNITVMNNLRVAQEKMCEILLAFNAICKEHNIDFWLDYGTLLGAVRHNGFIPWDDDIDIGMLRSDFELFNEIASQELPENVFYQTPYSDVNYNPFWVEAKLRSKEYLYVDDKEYKWQNGLMVDINVYDKVKGQDAIVCNFVKLDNKYHLKINEIELLDELMFEGNYFPVPLGYHSYLTRIYGDYMQMPDLKEQHPCHSKGMIQVSGTDSLHFRTLDW